MKNILIIEISRDNTEVSYNWFSDVNKIPDIDMKNAVSDAINSVNNVQSKPDKVQTYGGIIFSNDYGYYFSNLPSSYPPYQVDYVIQHIIE